MTDLAHPDRLAKLDRLREQGVDPYPARGVPGTPAAEITAGAGTAEAPGELLGKTVTEVADAWAPYLTMTEGIRIAAKAFTTDISKLSCCA